MILYHNPDASAGFRWQPTQADAVKIARVHGGEAKQRTVGEGGRQAMVDILNVNEEQAAPVSDETQQLPEVIDADIDRPVYQSPLTAATVIAGIDAGMCVSAVRQMDGKNLAKIVAAAIERMAQLAGQVA